MRYPERAGVNGRFIYLFSREGNGGAYVDLYRHGHDDLQRWVLNRIQDDKYELYERVEHTAFEDDVDDLL